MSRDPRLKSFLSSNFLGKRGFETWPEFLDRSWRHAVCRVLGHTKPVVKMDAPHGICGRCRVCL
jgi:hypothetical protein